VDLTGAAAAVKGINEQTIPEIAAALKEAIEELHGVLDRLNGVSVVVIVPPRKAAGG
jgi:hypothetical protein